jgi:hypothetical protein
LEFLQVFPEVYLWTSYPLACALESLWSSISGTLSTRRNETHIISTQSSKKTKSISPYVIEIIAALERALAMAFTGDPRSITTDLMGPLGLRKSLVEKGLPTLTTKFTFDLDLANGFSSNPSQWPLNSNNEPAIASKRVQLLTYGEAHYMVRTIIDYILSSFMFRRFCTVA